GSGKSSLVKTGLIEALEIGLMADAGSRWRPVIFAPGGHPLRSLARGLLGGQYDFEMDLNLARSFLTRGPRSIIEWCKDAHFPDGFNLLLLVDQFEELFRYQGYSGREEAEAFVALLIESARAKDIRIYVVLTMRSEYLAACSLIENLAEQMNVGQFLTPRLTR